MRATAVPTLGLVISLCASGCVQDTGLRSMHDVDTLRAPLVADDFEDFAIGQAWDEGETVGGWTNLFDGYGTVAVRAVDGSPALTAAPMAATEAGNTHAALVATDRSFGDVLDLQVRTTTLSQLRRGSEPNPWETAWVAWSYTDTEHFYYVALKTNGWELGKRDPAYPGGQRFLADGRDVTFPLGVAAEVEIAQDGAELTVVIDGVELARFVDEERPYLDGAVALYTEDAVVAFDDIVIAADE